MSHGRGKSDRGVVPGKLPNKAAGEIPAAAEVVEGRLRAKGNAFAARMSRRLSRRYDMGTALEGIRRTAKGRRDAKFSGLLHHIYAVERLQAAYFALRRDAAPGVDGQTWQSYGQDLQANLLERMGLEGEDAAIPFHAYASYTLGASLFAATRRVANEQLARDAGEESSPAGRFRSQPHPALASRSREETRAALDDMMDLSAVDPDRDEQLFELGLRRLIASFDPREPRDRGGDAGV